MPSPHVPSRGALAALLAAALALLAFLGAVMADTHVPVPVAPDLHPAGGAQLATFALG